jgi:hypothetical protein
MCKELDHCQGLVEPLTVLGEISLGENDFKEAEDYFHEAIKMAIEAWRPPYALHALVGMARLLAAKGEPERALKLGAFVQLQPASWQWSKDTLEPLVLELKKQVPIEVVEVAQMWGKEKNLEEVAEELSIIAE